MRKKSYIEGIESWYKEIEDEKVKKDKFKRRKGKENEEGWIVKKKKVFKVRRFKVVERIKINIDGELWEIVKREDGEEIIEEIDKV